MSEIKRQIKSGEMMQGICMQWFIDKHGDNKEAMKVAVLYAKILRYTFGYRQRFNYIKQNRFNMHTQQLKQHRDILVLLGLIEWKRTKFLTYYRILEPTKDIKDFVFTKKEIIDQEEKRKQEFEKENNKLEGLM